jgi:hypothetical protein
MSKIVELNAAEIQDVVGGVITAPATMSVSSNLQVSATQFQSPTSTSIALAPAKPVSPLLLLRA